VKREHVLRSAWVIPGLAFAAALALQSGTFQRIAAAVLVADIVAHFLPWSLPRAGRSGFGYWIETLAYLVPMLVLAVVALAVGDSALTAVADPIWFAVGVPVGIVLVLVSGIDLFALVRGDLAFLAGPSKASHALARSTGGIVAPFSEEAFFRGIGISLPNPSAILAVFSAAAFVARHHLLRGVSGRASRALLVELLAAGSFTLLAALSHSIYPSLVAHAINNLPFVILGLQQARATG
jgi:membrane protease YdiL (CAAX protease family)